MTHFLHNYIGSVVRPDDILTFIKINLEKENSKETVLKEHRHLYKYFVRHYNIV